MTTYYIATDGDDERDGISWETRWKTVPFDFTLFNLLRYPRKTWRDRHRRLRINDCACFSLGEYRETLFIRDGGE